MHLMATCMWLTRSQPGWWFLRTLGQLTETSEPTATLTAPTLNSERLGLQSLGAWRWTPPAETVAVLCGTNFGNYPITKFPDAAIMPASREEQNSCCSGHNDLVQQKSPHHNSHAN